LDSFDPVQVMVVSFFNLFNPNFLEAFF
jgi:hypothetical protein